MKLKDRKIAILIAPRGSEHSEVFEPIDAVKAEGAELIVVSTKSGTAKTVKGDLDPGEEFDVNRSLGETSADDFDGLIIPGGTVGADTLRGNADAVKFVKAFFASSKPVAAICHGPWLLIEAGAAKGRKLTSYPSLRTDITNAGGNWVDEEVVEDRGLITSRSPDDLPAFNRKMIDAFAR